MGAVGGVAILGGNFEAPTFPEDKVVQRSLTAGTQESSAIDAIILDALPLGAPGQLDSHAFLWKGHSNDGSPHTIDWKAFVNVTADDGTGSLWTLQTRIDGAPYTDILTVDDNGLLTVSGATFTMDQLIIDSDNTEAVLVRKDGDAGDVFIVDTVNDVVRLGSNDTFLTFGAASDVQLHRGDGVDILEQRRGANEQRLNIYKTFTDFSNYERLSLYTGGGPNPIIEIAAESAGTGGANIDLRIESLGTGSKLFLTRGPNEIEWLGNTLSFLPANTQTLSNINNLTAGGFVSIGNIATGSGNGFTIDTANLTGVGLKDSLSWLMIGKSFDTFDHSHRWQAQIDVTATDANTWRFSAGIDGFSGLSDVFTLSNSPAAAGIVAGFPGDVASLQLGAALDAQIHRGDAADIWEQRRGLNPQEWRLYDRFVSHADYDRLAVYIGGGPPLKTIEFVAETSNASQGINIDIEALPGGSSDGRVRLITGTTAFLVEPSRFGMNKVVNIDTTSSSSMTVNGFISNLGFGFAPGIAINIDTFGSNRDSHSIRMIGSGNLGNRATWQTFVEVIDGTANSIWTLQNDLNGGGFNDVLTISNGGLVSLPFSGSALAFGPSPAQSGTIRLGNTDSLTIRNAANSEDVLILSSPMSDEIELFDNANIPVVRFKNVHTRFDGRVTINTGTSTNQLLVGANDLNVDTTNNLVTISNLSVAGTLTTQGVFIIDITDTEAFLVRQNGDTGDIFTVDTTNAITRFNVNAVAGGAVTIDAEGIQMFQDIAFIRLGQQALVAPGVSDSAPLVMDGKSFDGGAHNREFRTFVDMTSNAGDGNWVLQTRLDAGGSVQLVVVPSNGRFAITQPEQVSIGSGTFLDNIHVNITGSFVDDYGGGPTETHKVKIQGGQFADAGRTARQTCFDASAFIVTGNASQTIQEVGQAHITAPAITPGTDTINIAYALKIRNTPTLVGAENYGLFVDSGSGVGNGVTALVRIGRETGSGLKLLVSGGAGIATNFDNTAQMRLTSTYVSGTGEGDSAMLLHVQSRVTAAPGTTDHISGAFFEGELRTQTAAESVANISQVQIAEPNITDFLTGGGLITNAQSLLITGAPTEGVSNYAQRILGGDLQVAASSAFLFRNNSNSLDLTALANAPTDFLEIGGVGAGEWERVNVYSLGRIQLNPTDDVRIVTDGGTLFQIRTITPNEAIFNVTPTQTRAVGQLVSVANLADHSAETQIQTTFADVATSAGSSVFAAGLIPAGSFLIGVTVRVLVGVGGPASFDVGDGTDVDRWGAAISSAFGTTTDITDFTSGAVTTFPFANDVRLTSTGVDFTSGSVRITVHYMTIQTSAA